MAGEEYSGLVSGISLTDAVDPNKEGWSCGAFLPNPNFNVCLGFVWDPITQKMRALPTLGGTNGFATGTNNFGETVGWAENTVHDSTCVAPQVFQFKPVVWVRAETRSARCRLLARTDRAPPRHSMIGDKSSASPAIASLRWGLTRRGMQYCGSMALRSK